MIGADTAQTYFCSTKYIAMFRFSIFLFTGAVTLFTACKKSSSPPENQPSERMVYFDLNNKQIRYGQPAYLLDCNGDGRKDLVFGVQIVGDPINQVDKYEFSVGADAMTRLPLNAVSEMPVCDRGFVIPAFDFSDYSWYQANAVVMMRKIVKDAFPDRWEGLWKNAQHKYIPFQVMRNNNHYNGYVEISTDLANEQIILHGGAICKYPEVQIITGE